MNTIPTVTKNLLIINVLMFLGTIVAQSYGIDLNNYLGLHFFLAGDFNAAQLITYMFMHGGFTHLFFNMFAVWMFGRILRAGLGAETLPVLLPRMRHRCRAYPGACTIHPLRNGAFRIRQCQYRVFHHPHGRISQHDDYRRSLRGRICHLAGIRHAVSQPTDVRLSATVSHQSQVFRYRICLDRIILGTCQQSGRQCGALCTFGRYDIRIHSNNVLEKKGQRKWLLL